MNPKHGLVVAEAAKTHTQGRIAQLEADLASIKSDKTQMQSLMIQYKELHSEDSKRYSEDLARIKQERARLEKDCNDARAELAKERSRVDEVRFTSSHKLSECSAALRKAEQVCLNPQPSTLKFEP